MSNPIMKHITHILNTIFLIIYIILFLILGKYEVKMDNNFIKTLSLIAIITSVLVCIEIIFYILKVICMKDLSNKMKHVICIWFLNIFYIPCFVIKNIYKDNNAKIKNIRYVIISLTLYIILFIVMINFGLSYNQNDLQGKVYISNDNVVCVFLPNEYEVKDGTEKNEMKFSKEDCNIGIFLYNNMSEGSQDVLGSEIKWLSNINDSFQILSVNNVHENGKEYRICYCSGKYKNDVNNYLIATITFDERKDYVVCFIGVVLQDDARFIVPDLINIVGGNIELIEKINQKVLDTWVKNDKVIRF